MESTATLLERQVPARLQALYSRRSARTRLFHRDDDEGNTSELRDIIDDSGSEATEDWEDGITLFGGVIRTDSL